MNVTVTADVRDVLDLAATFLDGRKAAEDLTKRLTRVVAKDSRERFEAEGPGWPQRKQEDTEEEKSAAMSAAIEGARARATEVVRKKLWREFRRAKRKFGEEAAQNRYEITREFERRVSGGSTGFSLVRQEDSEKLAKQMRSVEKRLVRAAERQEGKILGKLAGANKSSTRGTEGEVRNMAKFSKVQFEGGEVAHGAVLPPRPALGDTPELQKKLDHTIEGWMGELGGED